MRLTSGRRKLNTADAMGSELGLSVEYDLTRTESSPYQANKIPRTVTMGTKIYLAQRGLWSPENEIINDLVDR